MSLHSLPPPHGLTRRRFLTVTGALLLGVGLGFQPSPAAAFNPQQLRQSMQRLYGQSGMNVLEEWFSLLDRLQGQDIQTQLRDVNDPALFMSMLIEHREAPGCWHRLPAAVFAV